MWTEDFQDGHRGGRLVCRNRTILAILNLCVGPMPPLKFQLHPIEGLGCDVVWRISRWSPWHLKKFKLVTVALFYFFFTLVEIRTENVLAILIFYVSQMPPTRFRLNPTFPSEADAILRFSKWLQWRPSWISEWNNFSSSESACRPDASGQVSAKTDLRFGWRCGLKNFKMASMAAIFDI